MRYSCGHGHDPHAVACPVCMVEVRNERDEVVKALAWYANAENHQRPLVVDDEVGGTVPPNCPDKDAHLREKFRDCGFPVPLSAVPHYCGSDEGDETEKHAIAGVRLADYSPVAMDGGKRAREVLAALDAAKRGG